jgi:hypothetical protein
MLGCEIYLQQDAWPLKEELQQQL